MIILETIRAEVRDYCCGVSRLGEESSRLLAVSRVGAGEAVIFSSARIDWPLPDSKRDKYAKPSPALAD